MLEEEERKEMVGKRKGKCRFGGLSFTEDFIRVSPEIGFFSFFSSVYYFLSKVGLRQP